MPPSPPSHSPSPSYFVLALTHKGNRIGDDGAAALAKALEGKSALWHLDLGGMFRGMSHTLTLIPNHHPNIPPSHTRKLNVDTIDQMQPFPRPSTSLACV